MLSIFAKAPCCLDLFGCCCRRLSQHGVGEVLIPLRHCWWDAFFCGLPSHCSVLFWSLDALCVFLNKSSPHAILQFKQANGSGPLLCLTQLGARKSKSMAILILALIELDVEHKLKILFLCKENSGTRSFVDLLQWLDPPEAVLKRLGRLVGDQERNKSSYSHTRFDINPRERRQMLGKCQLVMATGGTVSQDLTMQWSTMSGFMQDLSLMVINEGQQYGTDREISTISLLRTQPLILWTGDAQQTPGGLARAAPNAKRSRQLLLAKQHGLRSNRRYFMPSTLAEAMAQLLENTSNEGLHLVKSILTRGTHVLGHVCTDQLTQPQADDLNAINSVLPGLPAQFRTATPQEVTRLPRLVDPQLLEGTTVNFSRSLIRVA